MDFAEAQRRPGKHPIGLIVVAAMHVVLGYALVNGLGKRIVDVIKGPIETKIIEEAPPPPPPPPDNLPPPPKNLPPPPSYVPPPEVQVAPQPTNAPTITTTTVAPPPAPVTFSPAPPTAPPAPPAPAYQPKPAIVNVHACAPKGDDYPAAAVRAEATGTTKIRFTIDASGALVKTEVVKSAGSSREHKMLDRVAASKLSECAFKPAVDEHGKAVGGSFDVDYVWKLD